MSGDSYKNLHDAVDADYESLSKIARQEIANLLWKTLKENSKNVAELTKNTESTIKTLKQETAARTTMFTNYFVQTTKLFVSHFEIRFLLILISRYELINLRFFDKVWFIIEAAVISLQSMY